MSSTRPAPILMIHSGKSIKTVNAKIKAENITVVKISSSLEPVVLKNLDRSVDTLIFCKGIGQALVENTPRWIQVVVFQAWEDYQALKDLLPSKIQVRCFDKEGGSLEEDSVEIEERPTKKRRLLESKDDQEFIPVTMPDIESDPEPEPEPESEPESEFSSTPESEGEEEPVHAIICCEDPVEAPATNVSAVPQATSPACMMPPMQYNPQYSPMFFHQIQTMGFMPTPSFNPIEYQMQCLQALNMLPPQQLPLMAIPLPMFHHPQPEAPTKQQGSLDTSIVKVEAIRLTKQ